MADIRDRADFFTPNEWKAFLVTHCILAIADIMTTVGTIRDQKAETLLKV